MLRIFKNALMPIVSLETLASNVFDVHYNWIKENLGEQATSILDLILDYAKDERFDIKYSNKQLHLKENIDYEILNNNIIKELNNIIIENGEVHGDIKQYLYPYGKVSFGYGSIGIIGNFGEVRRKNTSAYIEGNNRKFRYT